MRWLTLLLAGCVLITASTRTVDIAPRADRAASQSREHLELRSALTRIQVLENEYQELARADSLLQLLPRAPGIAVSLPLLDTDHREAVEAAVAREMQEIERPRVRLGVFAVDASYGRRTAVPYPVASRRQLLVGADSAGPYCVVVGTGVVVGDSIMNTIAFGFGPNRRLRRPQRTVLGACGFVARYGLPGASIDEWLRAGASEFAELRPETAATERERIDLPRWTWHGVEITIRACRGGRTDRCRALFIPSTRSGRGGSAYDVTLHGPPGSVAVRSLLHDLETEFGARRFEAFWSSDADVEVAFAGAFGTDVGAWVRRWAESRHAATSLGPRLAGSDLGLAVLLIALFGFAAAAITARREV